MDQRKHSVWFVWLAGIVILILLTVGYIASRSLDLEDTDTVLAFVRSYGPAVAIPVIILEVIIAPIPGGVFPIVLGAIYGPFLGALYAWIGNVAGSIIAFWLAKKFGRRLLFRLFPKIHFDAFEAFVDKRPMTVWLIYALPVFPIDIMSFAVGLSKMDLKKFSWIVSTAYIPHLLLLTLLGDFFIDAETPERVTIAVIVFVILAVSFWVEHHINKRKEKVVHKSPSMRG